MLFTLLSHASIATGNKAWAVAKPLALLHCTVVFKAAAAVVQVGATVSTTLMTILDWEQLVGFNFSQILYTKVYCPTDKPLPITEISPEVKFRETFAFAPEINVILTKLGEKEALFKRSLVITFPRAPAVEHWILKLFATANIAGAVTVIVTVAGSQFVVGFTFSHKLYSIVYVPAGVPIGTETWPVAVSIDGTAPPPIEVAGVVTVMFTWVITAGEPFKVSAPLPLLFKIFPALGFPVVPLPPLSASFWAMIAGHLVIVNGKLHPLPPPEGTA